MKLTAVTALIATLIVVALGSLFVFTNNRRPHGKFQTIGHLIGPRSMTLGFGMNADARLLVTQATTVGPYTVSFRQVRLDGLSRSFTIPSERLRSYGIGIQVLTGMGSDNFKLDTASLRARDNTGTVIVGEPASTDRADEINGGRLYQQRMSLPAPNATRLDSLDGSLLITDELGAHAEPFHLEGIPLPNAPVLHGIAVPLIVNPGSASVFSSGLSVLTGPSAEKAMKSCSLFPLTRGAPPYLLLVGEGYSEKFGATSPADKRKVGVKALIGPVGKLDLDVTDGGKGWHGSIWDSDSILAILPAEPGKARVAVAFRLSRERGIAPAPPVTIQSPFPSRPGVPGGSIASSVRVADHPFGRGQLQMQISQRIGNDWSNYESVLVPVRYDGVCIIPNLTPGEYRIRRSTRDLVPKSPGNELPWKLADYLRERFGSENGTWKGISVDSVLVRAGQRTEVPPLQWNPSPNLPGNPGVNRTSGRPDSPALHPTN